MLHQIILYDAILVSVKISFANIHLFSYRCLSCLSDVYTLNLNEKFLAGSGSGGFYGKHLSPLYGMLE